MRHQRNAEKSCFLHQHYIPKLDDHDCAKVRQEGICSWWNDIGKGLLRLEEEDSTQTPGERND